SDRAADLFGVARGTLFTRERLLQKLHPEDRDPTRAAMPRTEEEGIYDREYRVRVGDELRWLAARGKAIVGADGAISTMIGIVQDVTASRVAAAQLRDREEKFRTLAQTMLNHAWTATPDGLLDWLNEQTMTYSGLAMTALCGTGWTQLVHPDDLAEAGAAWQTAIQNEAPYETVFRIRRADGDYRWHLVRSAPIRNEAGVVSSWVGTNTDIEEQHRVRDTLARMNSALSQRVEERTRERNRLWDVSQDLLLVVGADGIFRDVNPAVRRLLGYEPSEIVGRSQDDILHPDDRLPSHQALEQALLGAMPRFENRVVHRDGRVRWFSWTASPDEHGLLYANGRDVSDEREARDKLAAAEHALRQSQKMEAVGKLTSGIAHDFNNLLHGIVTAMNVVKNQIVRGTVGT
ncbi:MAG: PAS domain S-box protein, partial [Proteobacteria bacterium]